MNVVLFWFTSILSVFKMLGQFRSTTGFQVKPQWKYLYIMYKYPILWFPNCVLSKGIDFIDIYFLAEEGLKKLLSVWRHLKNSSCKDFPLFVHTKSTVKKTFEKNYNLSLFYRCWNLPRPKAEGWRQHKDSWSSAQKKLYNTNSNNISCQNAEQLHYECKHQRKRVGLPWLLKYSLLKFQCAFKSLKITLHLFQRRIESVLIM